VAEEGDRLGAVLELDLVHLLGDVVERLVPARRAVLAVAAGRALDADHGGLEAVGVVGLGDGALAAGAEHAARLRVLGVAVDLADLAALDDALMPHFQKQFSQYE
jgi:hypothetical protein